MHTNYANATTLTLESGDVRYRYRKVGPDSGRPLVMLNHLTGVLDDWDPAVVDGLARTLPVVTFDNRGVGGTSGQTPDSITAMAKDAIAFIDSLGFTQIDLVGFSMGGFIAQVIAKERPQLVRRLVLAGTGPAGGTDISAVTDVLRHAIEVATQDGRHPKHILFFSQSTAGQLAANEFLARLQIRTVDRDTPISNDATNAQLTAIVAWGHDSTSVAPLDSLTQPVLVINGDCDVMVPTVNSWALFQGLPNAELSIFPDSGHGGLFQHHEAFVSQVLGFLANPNKDQP
jgi:pimeloyl-ACP methyl ester carboxylesterase